jgi:hypothetical protein
VVERGAGAVGIREVLLLAALIVGIVLGIAFATSLLPVDAQRLVFRTPLLILVLVGGTILVLMRLVRRPPDR